MAQNIPRNGHQSCALACGWLNENVARTCLQIGSYVQGVEIDLAIVR